MNEYLTNMDQQATMCIKNEGPGGIETKHDRIRWACDVQGVIKPPRNTS